MESLAGASSAVSALDALNSCANIGHKAFVALITLSHRNVAMLTLHNIATFLCESVNSATKRLDCCLMTPGEHLQVVHQASKVVKLLQTQF